ncbi:hypothetical protein [Actinosynnema sp. NPDC020468]|uniref:hypothetical protein n=1 Tax=Actinosynnema sp. NPDC020468 TaxID=3154488 RepID=UPI00341017F8
MTPPIRDLVEELKGLRKGHGVESIDLRDRVGPALRQVAGVASDDTTDQIRAKVRALLEELIAPLPEALRPVLGLAFNLPARDQRYIARVEAYALERRVDTRTIQRQIDPGIEQLAESAAKRAGQREEKPARQPPWRTADLRVFLSFDLAAPEVIEVRRIIALRDGLDALDLGMTLTPPPGWTGEGSPEDLGVDLLHGGGLTGRTMRNTNRVQFRLSLPRPLERFSRHEYALRVRLPPDRGIAPLYACTPDYECDSFELSVRFRADHLPVRVWRLPGISPLELDDERSGRVAITPDRFGDVRETFTDLEPHLSYGIGWQLP